ncbi:MAG: hypothetical protein CMO81_07075 [Waddliaceae bacterium]|nr:hypothetical protein [Waddliaceae bacterium]
MSLDGIEPINNEAIASPQNKLSEVKKRVGNLFGRAVNWIEATPTRRKAASVGLFALAAATTAVAGFILLSTFATFIAATANIATLATVPLAFLYVAQGLALTAAFVASYKTAGRAFHAAQAQWKAAKEQELLSPKLMLEAQAA